VCADVRVVWAELFGWGAWSELIEGEVAVIRAALVRGRGKPVVCSLPLTEFLRMESRHPVIAKGVEVDKGREVKEKRK